MTVCHFCGASLKRKRFAMTPEKVRLCHGIARKKGLDDEIYRLRLAAVGVSSCKDLKRDSFLRFIEGLKALPDVN